MAATNFSAGFFSRHLKYKLTTEDRAGNKRKNSRCEALPGRKDTSESAGKAVVGFECWSGILKRKKKKKQDL